MKTYSDALLSMSLSTQMAMTPANIVTLALLLFLFKIDKTVSLYLESLLGLDHRLAYWMLYLLYYVLAIALNMMVILKHLGECRPDPNDINRILAHITGPKPMKDLISGKTIQKRIPKLIIIMMGPSILFSLWYGIDNIILSPLEKALLKQKSEYLYNFNQSTIYGITLLSTLIPYLYAILATTIHKVISLTTKTN
jgi:hypothetical protein